MGRVSRRNVDSAIPQLCRSGFQTEASVAGKAG